MIEERMKRLGSKIDPRWSQDRVETSLDELHRRIRGRRRRGLVAAGGAALAAGALVFAALSPWETVGPGDGGAPARPAVVKAATDVAGTDAAPREPAVAPPVVTERATATPLSADAVVRASDEPGADDVAMRVERGTVRFTVARDPAWPFRVEAGPVVVEVLGTEFTVARDGERTTVSVMDGAVRVRWRGGETTLRAGESRRFPPDQAAASRRAAPRQDASDPDALLAAADRAQLDGRMQDALSLIERALARSTDAAHEAAAAFTLGRARSRLGEHERAAGAFARARAADPDGTLAEDALAREVEAWARAGRRGRAREAARLYRERYPDGRRTRMVRQFGDDER